MRTALAVVALSAIAASGFAAPDEVSCNTPVVGRITGIAIGSVSTQSAGEEQIKIIRRQMSTRVRKGMPLCAGDRIQVLGASVLVMSLGASEADITVHGVTSFELANSKSIFLLVGKLFATLRGFFEARTQTVTLAAKGTEFQVEVTEAGTEILQLEGELEVMPVAPPEARLGRRLTPLRRLTIPSGGASPEVSPAGEESVRKAVDANANVILSMRPARPSVQLIPNFDSDKERAAAYREARFRTIWSPEDKGQFEILGNVYVDWAEPAKAIAAYVKSGEPSAGDERHVAVYNHNLATAYRLVGDFTKAGERLARAIKINPSAFVSNNDAGDFYLDEAGTAYRRGDADGARKLLERAESAYDKVLEPALQGRAEPNHAKPAYHRGEVALLRANANLEEARRYFNLALKFEPESLFARVGLARVAEAANDVERATAQYQDVLRRDPSFAPAHLYMGYLHARRGNWEEALASFLRATQSDPDFAAPFHAADVALTKLGRSELAQSYSEAYAQLASPLVPSPPHPPPPPSSSSSAPTPTPTPVPPPPPVIVPELRGETWMQASDDLPWLGLTLRAESVDSRAARGLIVRQDPPPGTLVKRGSVITVYVSTGRNLSDEVVVPYILKMSADQARAEVEKYGLRFLSQYSGKPSHSAYVRHQEPKAGTRVPRGTVVVGYIE
ncbi:MAG TPA: PASTA domain-containing protein [Thermoanaerobaculia bacterium]|nr:PASTA domain-containing protein [Thermoanaerobaculia bacterium]